MEKNYLTIHEPQDDSDDPLLYFIIRNIYCLNAYYFKDLPSIKTLINLSISDVFCIPPPSSCADNNS